MYMIFLTLSRFFPIITLLFFLFFSGSLTHAIEQNEREPGENRKNSTQKRSIFSGKEPIEISSEELWVDSNSNIAIFKGSVIAKQGVSTVYSDWIEVTYSKEGDIKKLHAKGRVKLIDGTRMITSDEALFFNDEGKIIFTGTPVAKEKESIITGTKMTYYIDTGHSIVENSRVVIMKQ